MQMAPAHERTDAEERPSDEIALQKRKNRVFAALAAEVSSRGYHNTTVTDIVQRAGITHKAFFELFDDREDCLLQAFDAAVGAAREQVVAAYHRAPWLPLRDRVAAGLAAFLKYCAAEPEFARLCIVEVLTAGDRGRERRDAAIREFAAFIEHPRAEARGETAPSLVSEAIAGGLYGVLYTRVSQGETARLPELLDELMDAGLGQLVARADSG